MEQVGNAMTANYGDETDDGVCEHEDYDIRTENPEYSILVYLASFNIKCNECGANGRKTLYEDAEDASVEWTA